MSKKYDMQSVDELLTVLSKPKPPIAPRPPVQPPVAPPVQAQAQPGWLGNPLQAVIPSSPLSTGLREQAKQGFGETAELFKAGYPGQAMWRGAGTVSNLVGGAMMAPIAATFPRTMAGVGKGLEYVAQNAPSFLTTASGIPIPLSGTPQRPLSQEFAAMKEQYPSVYKTGGDVLSTAMMFPYGKAVGALKGVKLPAAGKISAGEKLVASGINKIPVKASSEILETLPGSTSLEKQRALQTAIVKYGLAKEAKGFNNQKSMNSLSQKAEDMIAQGESSPELLAIKNYADERLMSLSQPIEKAAPFNMPYKRSLVKTTINLTMRNIGRPGISPAAKITVGKKLIESGEGRTISLSDIVNRPAVKIGTRAPVSGMEYSFDELFSQPPAKVIAYLNKTPVARGATLAKMFEQKTGKTVESLLSNPGASPEVKNIARRLSTLKEQYRGAKSGIKMWEKLRSEQPTSLENLTGESGSAHPGGGKINKKSGESGSVQLPGGQPTIQELTKKFHETGGKSPFLNIPEAVYLDKSSPNWRWKPQPAGSPHPNYRPAELAEMNMIKTIPEDKLMFHVADKLRFNSSKTFLEKRLKEGK